MLFPAQDEECREVAALDDGDVAGIVLSHVTCQPGGLQKAKSGGGWGHVCVRTLDDVVGAGAGGWRLAGEIHAEDAGGAVSRSRWGRAADDLDGISSNLTVIAHLDGAVVLQNVPHTPQSALEGQRGRRGKGGDVICLG